jgi:hypothetical protein
MENETAQGGSQALKKIGMHTIKMISSIVIVVLLIIVGIYFGRKVDPQKIEALNNQRLMQNVAHLIVVPNETPIIATINQPDVLVKEQLFYAGSNVGDKLIIFPQAQKAIIYSPGRNVIVNSGPFIVNSGTQTQAQTQTATPDTKTPAKK